MSYFAQLRTFVEVYRSGSISRAANNLNVSQPSATSHIQSLEAMVGQPLFIRKARGVVATPTAHDLAQQVSHHFDAIERKIASVRGRGNELQGTINIAGPAEYISYVASAQLANLLQAGQVRANIHLGNRAKIYQMLSNGDVELAISASVPDSSQFDYQILDRESLTLVANPFTAKQILNNEISAEHLSCFPVVSYDTNLPLIREYFAQTFNAQCQSEIAALCPDIRALKGLVKAGLGYTVLPDYLCDDAIKANHLVKLGIDGPENLIYLVWRKGALANPRVEYAQDILLAFSNINQRNL